ncbi:nucleotide pyrophosphatase [Bacillus halotolerans]|uniref:nucleotide pyrophosphatase n=1 Tax=Bacillus halotolerans TaxID=260554 RepID=UPI001C0F2C67|nr:nucleotide pyrophosphatase [Bacillus halotolerans]MBU5247184.1 nucleotide pyrophosphatase [Bacillus halotolerans]MEC1600763.1 nucleotide pyrophosphatase [Bacillus halotolerans]
MRLAVRLSNDTIKFISELENIYSAEFGGLTLSQGHVVSKAFHLLKNCHENLEDIDWMLVKEEKLKSVEFEIKSSVTSLNLSEETINGIKDMQGYLPGKLGGKRVNTDYCIRLIVKAALLRSRSV